MILRSRTDDKNGDLRHVGMDSRHPGPQGCFRKHPCQPGFQRSMLEMTQWRSCIKTNQEALHLSYFKGGVEEHDVYNESDLAFV